MSGSDAWFPSLWHSLSAFRSTARCPGDDAQPVSIRTNPERISQPRDRRHIVELLHVFVGFSVLDLGLSQLLQDRGAGILRDLFIALLLLLLERCSARGERGFITARPRRVGNEEAQAAGNQCPADPRAPKELDDALEEGRSRHGIEHEKRDRTADAEDTDQIPDPRDAPD